MNSSVTRFAFLAGTVYFLCMATAHFFGLKYPLLFVYYDTAFYAYQDKIISFGVLAFAALFFQAAQCRAAIPMALGVMVLTISGLASINMSETLALAMEPSQSTIPYWIQVGLFVVYWLVLAGLWRRDATNS